MKQFKLYLFIILLSLFPVIDVFKTPDLPHTSDGAMHVVRFGSFYKEFIAGQFPIRWASQLNYGYGMPFFNFFHPLPYIVSLPFVASGMTLVSVLKVSFVLSYVLAGIFMLLFSLSFFKDEKTALLVTVMYQFSPFRLVDMLVRGSLGSLYSYTLLPLLFYFLVKFLEKKTYPWFVGIAIATALLSMSHNIIGFVFFGITVLFIPFLTKKPKEIILLYGGLGIGLLLASYYLIPAIIEHKYTYGYLLTKDLFYNHFPALYKFFVPNITNLESLRVAEVPVQFGLFHVLSLAVLLYYLLKKKLDKKYTFFALYLFFVTIATIAFMEPVTKTLWVHISFLRQFQFPWRLLSIISVTTGLSSFIFLSIPVMKNKVVYFGLIVAIVLSTIYYWIPYQGYQKANQQYYWNYPQSTNYFGEINSIWMAGEPTGFPKQRIEVIAGPATIQNIHILPEKHQFTVEASQSASLVDRTQFYPGWKVFVDNTPTAIQFQDQNYRGLITFSVPPGKHDVTIQYGENRLQLISDGITLITGVLLITGFFVFRKKTYGKSNS